MTRVLIVESSDVVRDLLNRVLSSDPHIQVVATAADGEEAMRKVDRLKPGLIVVNAQLPGIDGFETTSRIMQSHPTPTVMLATHSGTPEKMMASRAAEAGALAVLPPLPGAGHPDYKASAANLIRTVKLMSEVKVIRRWNAAVPPNIVTTAGPNSPEPVRDSRVDVVAIGASTGGPVALQSIVSGLPATFPVPVLVVQHIASGFVDGFADWLGQSSSLPVRVPAHGEAVRPGHIYVAPDGHHMKSGPGGRLVLSGEPPENGLRPAVSSLFRSVAESYGQRAAGVLLSGMGTDGAWELKRMRDKGAVTIAQDYSTSVVHGMPGEAIRLRAATYILRPEEIAPLLVALTVNQTGSERIPSPESHP